MWVQLVLLCEAWCMTWFYKNCAKRRKRPVGMWEYQNMKATDTSATFGMISTAKQLINTKEYAQCVSQPHYTPPRRRCN